VSQFLAADVVVVGAPDVQLLDPHPAEGLDRPPGAAGRTFKYTDKGPSKAWPAARR
jgi:FMN-dependent NADH-azoreductase